MLASPPFGLLIVVACLAAVPGVGCAQQQDSLQWSISQMVQHDSNVLRLPDSAGPTATGGRPRADWVSRTAAGVALDREFGLQHVQAMASVSATRFASYGGFDTNGYNASAGWTWGRDAVWYGETLVRADRQLASFADIRVTTSNVVDTEFARASLGRRLTPSWSLVGLADFQQRHNSSPQLRAADLREQGFESGLRWEPKGGADWSVLYRHAEGRYGDVAGAVSGASGNDYTLDRVFTRMSWAPNDISRLSGDIGYFQRRQAGLSDRSARGLSYSLTYSWRPAGALVVDIYARRNTGAFTVLSAVYPTVASYGLQSTWKATGKLSVQLVADYFERAYGASSPLLLAGITTREDRVASLGAGLVWETARGLDLTAQLRQDRRRSNDAQFEFVAQVATVSLSARF